MSRELDAIDDTIFYDQASGRFMKLVCDGPYAGWLCYRHPDRKWVTLRKATDEDRAAISSTSILESWLDDPRA